MPSSSPLQEESEESSGNASGDLTPPIGFCVASDGSLHGDMNMMGSMMADPATLMILNAMSGVIGKKLAEKVNKGDAKDLLPKVMGKDMMLPALRHLQ